MPPTTERESQNNFKTVGLPPINSVWRQDSWDSRQEIFLQLNRCGHSPCVTSFLTRGRVFLLWIGLAFVKCTYLIYIMLLKILHCAQVFCQSRLCKADHVFLILCYNGSLITSTVVSVTTATYNSLMLSISGFALSYIANMFILMILYDFCLLPVQFCYIIVYIPKVESRV
jgi:hypothetical protein